MSNTEKLSGKKKGFDRSGKRMRKDNRGNISVNDIHRKGFILSTNQRIKWKDCNY